MLMGMGGGGDGQRVVSIYIIETRPCRESVKLTKSELVRVRGEIRPLYIKKKLTRAVNLRNTQWGEDIVKVGTGKRRRTEKKQGA
jgi:hypothetical protein